MTESDVSPVFDYPEDAPVAPRRKSKRLAIFAAVITLVALVLGAVIWKFTRNEAPAAPAALDYCAATDDGTSLRAKLVYTDTRFLETEPEQVNNDENGRWCVFAPNYDAGLYWAAVYVGENNGLYRTMIAENGDDDNATRAVVTYQGIPPVKFARDGWVAFLAQNGDGEQWTAFRTGAGAMLLTEIANAADGHPRVAK